MQCQTMIPGAVQGRIGAVVVEGEQNQCARHSGHAGAHLSRELAGRIGVPVAEDEVPAAENVEDEGVEVRV